MWEGGARVRGGHAVFRFYLVDTFGALPWTARPTLAATTARAVDGISRSTAPVRASIKRTTTPCVRSFIANCSVTGAVASGAIGDNAGEGTAKISATAGASCSCDINAWRARSKRFKTSR